MSNVANLRLNDVIRINYSLTDFVVGTITNISGNNVSLLISNQGNQSYVVGALVTDIPNTLVYTGVTPLNGRTNLPSACIITGLQGNYGQSAFGQGGTITATVNTASSGNLAGLTYSISGGFQGGFSVTQLLSVPIGTGVFCNGPSPYTVAFSTTTNSVSWRTTTTQGGNTYFGEILGYNLAYNSGTVQIITPAPTPTPTPAPTPTPTSYTPKQTTFSIATTGVRHESFVVGTDTVVRCWVDTSATGTITFLNPNKTSSDPISLRVLLVGGGGAGGKATWSTDNIVNFVHGGGGGGGGRVVDTTTQTVFSQAHSFGIGVGGFNMGTAYSNITSSSYSQSTQSFFNEVSAGGGGTGVSGFPKSSEGGGGGGAFADPAGGFSSSDGGGGGNLLAGNGNRPGAGGGGAAGNGGNAGNGYAGTGGIGRSSDINGGSFSYGGGGGGGYDTLYGGGVTLGGGGNGGTGSDGVAGIDGLGGGGGGAGVSYTSQAGRGGNGQIVFRFQTLQ